MIGFDISIIERPSVPVAGRDLSIEAVDVTTRNEYYSMCLFSPSRTHAGGLIERTVAAYCQTLQGTLAGVEHHQSLQRFCVAAVPCSEMTEKSETWPLGHLNLVGMAAEIGQLSGGG